MKTTDVTFCVYIRSDCYQYNVKAYGLAKSSFFDTRSKASGIVTVCSFGHMKMQVMRQKRSMRVGKVYSASGMPKVDANLVVNSDR
jgi:hypothetical protein